MNKTWDMAMIRRSFPLTTVIFLLFTISLTAQEGTSPTESDTVVFLTKRLGMYIFPSQGQDSVQQKKDLLSCYHWARSQSGVDPFHPPRVEAQEVKGGADGSAVRGAARGAAAGAAIGAITGDAGDGAAVGALSGALAGRRSRINRTRNQKKQSQQTASQQEQQLLNNFKKAFAACLEGKGYTVK